MAGVAVVAPLKTMHAIPANRFIAAIALIDRLKHFGVIQQVAVTIHAGLCRRHASGGEFINHGVAIPAVNPNVSDVMLVTERARLLQDRILPGPIR